MRLLKRILKRREGATAIEYGLIAALIAIVTIAGLSAVGTDINKQYGTIASSVTGAA